MTVRRLWALAALLALAAGARASDPIGIYALIDRVELEPSTGDAERIRLWGVFEIATPGDRNDYQAPERGYLYLKIDPKKPEQCRKEWNDLKKLAGTGNAVAFGNRHEQKTVTVRKGADPTKDPDTYSVGFGLTKLDATWWHARRLKALPIIASPKEGEDVAAGSFTLRVKNGAVPLEKVKILYVFEIEDAKGKKEQGKMAEGDKETTWTPEMKIEAGQKYTWRVWLDGKEKSPVASGTFKGKGGK